MSKDKTNTELNKKLDFIISEISEIKKFMDFVNTQYEEIKQENKQIVQEQKEIHENMREMRIQVNDLKIKVQKVEDKNDQLEKNSLINNVILKNVPQEKNEDLKRIVSHIFKKINAKVDMDSCIEINRRREKKNGVPGEIMIKCSNIEDKFNIIKSIKSHIITNKDILKTAKPEIRIYGNEDLTRHNKDLFYKALLIKKDKPLKFLWTHNGKVLVKQAEESQTIWVRSEIDLDKLN